MRIAITYNKFTYHVEVVVIDDQGNRSAYRTGVKVIPNHWDKKNRQVSPHHPNHLNFNKQIIRKFQELEKLVIENPDLVKATEVKLLRIKSQERAQTLNQFIEEYAYENFKPNSARLMSQKTWMEVLSKFDDHITFNKINRQLLYEYDEFLVNEEYADTTIKLYHLFMKSAIREAERFKYIDPESNPYNGGFKFHYESDTNNAIYLEDYEIKAMYSVRLSGNLKVVRDYFVISCYTALDFSTIKKLEKENIYDKGGKKYIRIQRVKTKSNVIIPVHPLVNEILESYSFSMPDMPYTLRHYNNVIKDIAREAGINQYISITVDRVDRLVPKHELVSSHTGRRSAATNMYLAGIKPLQIRMITGHRTEEAFMKYIRISKQYNAELVSENKFFNF